MRFRSTGIACTDSVYSLLAEGTLMPCSSAPEQAKARAAWNSQNLMLLCWLVELAKQEGKSSLGDAG